MLYFNMSKIEIKPSFFFCSRSTVRALWQEIRERWELLDTSATEILGSVALCCSNLIVSARWILSRHVKARGRWTVYLDHSELHHRPDSLRDHVELSPSRRQEGQISIVCLQS